MHTTLLLTFPETDSGSEVSRESLENLAKKLGLSEAATVHKALRLLVDQQLAQEYADDGPLTEEYREWLQNEADKMLGSGPRIWKEKLF